VPLADLARTPNCTMGCGASATQASAPSGGKVKHETIVLTPTENLRVALQCHTGTFVSCPPFQGTSPAQLGPADLCMGTTIGVSEVFSLFKTKDGKVALRNDSSSNFLLVDPLRSQPSGSQQLLQSAIAFPTIVFEVVADQAGRTGKVALRASNGLFLSCQSGADGRSLIRADKEQVDPSALFTVHRLGVPPPPPPEGAYYHIYTPKGGHPGQRKYLKFTGAIKCPGCQKVLGVDKTTTCCQCSACKTNIVVRYAKPVKLSDQYSSGLEEDALVCAMVGGVVVASVLAPTCYDMLGDVDFEPAGEAVADVAVAGAEGVADGTTALWDSGLGDALEDGGEVVVDGAVEAGGFIADGAAEAGGLVVEGAEAVWESGVLQDAGGMAVDGATAVWDSGVLQDVGDVACDVGEEIADVGEDFAEGAGDFFEDIGDAFGDLF